MGVFPKEMVEVEIDGVTRRVVRSQPGVPEAAARTLEQLRVQWRAESGKRWGTLTILGLVACIYVSPMLALFTGPLWLYAGLECWERSGIQPRASKISRWPVVAIALVWGLHNQLWLTMGWLLWGFLNTNPIHQYRPGY